MEHFDELLDDIEHKVEDHKLQALAVVDNRQELVQVLESITRSAEDNQALTDIDREEVKAKVSRLQERLDTVQVQVASACRDESQEEALAKINMKIDDLIAKVESGSREEETLSTAQSYMNACNPRSGAVVCSRFEALLLSCTLDDQKDIKRRVTTIVETVLALSNSSEDD